MSPFCGRISSLFFRRALSSTPGPDAARFFRQVLDLEAYGARHADDEGARPGRVAACSHLGLALCELPEPATLSARLRRAAPGSGYRTLRWPGSELWAATGPWPAAREGVSLEAARSGLQRTKDALELLKDRSLDGIARPISAVVLLQLASALLWEGENASNSNCVAGAASPRRQAGQQVPSELLCKAIIWRALLAARQFAMDATPRPEAQPFFSELPSNEELLLRSERLGRKATEGHRPWLRHLSGRALLIFANGSLKVDTDECALLEELEHRLARLEEWLEALESDGSPEEAEMRWAITSHSKHYTSCTREDPHVWEHTQPIHACIQAV